MRVAAIKKTTLGTQIVTAPSVSTYKSFDFIFFSVLIIHLIKKFIQNIKFVVMACSIRWALQCVP